MAAKTAKAWMGMRGVLLVAMKDTTCQVSNCHRASLGDAASDTGTHYPVV
jgi:hypothetical protein